MDPISLRFERLPKIGESRVLYRRVVVAVFCVALLPTILNAEDEKVLLPTEHEVGFLESEFADEELPEPDEKTIEERLSELESNYKDLTEDHTELEESYEKLKSSLKWYAQSGHKDATMKVNGRIHIDYWAFPGDSPGVNAFENLNPDISPQDRFGFRRMRFGVKGDIWENMRYKLEMEFAGGDDSEFRDVYLGWKELPVLRTLLIGNQKRPYGLDHLNSSRFNVFLERPFIIEAFNQDARRLGVESYGYSSDLAWNWRYGVFNLRLIQDEGFFISDHYQPEVAGRLANTLWYDECSDGRGYAHWAVSGSWANPDGTNNGVLPPFGRADNEARFRTRPEARTDRRWLDTGFILGADHYQLLGLEGVLNVGPVQIVGEYQNLWLQRRENSEIHLHGGYAYVSYFLTGEHMPWNRERGTLARIIPFENFFLVDRCQGGVGKGCGAWQIALRWSYGDLTDQDIEGGIGESVTFGLNWYWNPYARMQFNYIYGNIHSHRPVDGFTFGNYQIIGTRFMVDF